MAKETSDLSGRQPPSPRNVNIYDATNSFVKKMTTKMTDLIPQSLRLSKWFNSTENIADTLDGKENAENAEFEEEQPPPNKRIRMDRTYPPGTFSIQTRAKGAVNTIDLSKEQSSVHSNMTEDFLDQATPGPSGLSCLMSSTVQADIRDVTSHKSDLNSLTSLTNDGITNGTDDNSESSETSGCSSLIQQMNRFEGPALYSSTFSSRKRHIDDKLRLTSSLQSSKSSFLNSSSRETLSSRRPRFNESVVTNVLQRTSALSSPFYDGNTTFGGANMAGFYSQNRNSFNTSLNQLELKVPKRTNVEVTPNVTESDSSGMSQTAKKILEALEHFSSPISDAKKIPLKNASNAVSSILNKKRTEGTKKIGLRHLARELTVPTVPDILKLKRRQKLQDTTLTVRKIVSARSNPPPPSQDYWLRMEFNDGEKYRGKLKGKSKINLEQEETVMPVNLPNIPLPITTLPNFNFSIPTPNIHFAAGKTVANKENTFIFASPIKMINVEEDVEPVKSFTFSNPIDIDDSENKTKTNDLSSSSLAQNTSSVDGTAMPNFIWSGSSTAPRLKAKMKGRQDNPMEFAMLIKPEMENITDLLCQKSNKTESDAIRQSDLKMTSEKAHTDKTDSICVNLTSNIKSTPISKFWECSECLIRNNDIDKQCNACKVPRPDPEDKTSSTTLTSTMIVIQTKPVANDCFGSHFKLSKDQWECTSCYVRNKRNNNKCVACCMPKSENNTVQQTIKPQTDLMEKFKPATGSWECSGCLLRNAENVLTCPCCDASKPNSSEKVLEKRRNKETITENNTVDTKNVAMQASASNNSDVMNKFKPSKDSWECPGCLVRNNSSVTTCPCCSTAKPNSGDEQTIREHVPSNGFGDKFTKPKDAWNCDSCLLQNDAKHTECVACQAPKPGVIKTTKSVSNTDSILQFKFGIPSSTSNVSNHSSGFKFDTNKADTQSKSDTASSLNGFKFVSVAASQQNSGAAQFTFGFREENKVTSEVSKSSCVTTSSISTGLNTKTSEEESESIKKDLQNKQEISFNTPTDNNLTIANEKLNTSIVTTSTMLITPIFTFGVKKSESDQTALNKEKEKSTTAIESVLTEEAAVITTTTTISESTPITKITLPTPIFSFGVPSTKSTDAIALFSSTASTNATIPCLPTFAQSTFTFSDSKIMSQPSTTITTFGQVPTSSTASSANLSFGENKVIETIASSFTKSTSDVSTTSSIFPIVSSSTSFFNNNTINNETKTTMAFGSDKSAFTTTYNKPSGFGTTENKYLTFGSSTEAKSSIFEMSETKLPVFNPSSQTPASNSLPTFGTFGSNSTPVFGSVTTHGFSAVTTTPTVFSSTKPNEPIASNSSLFTFGSASSQQPTSGGFNFTANANSVMNSPAAKPLFTFGSNSSTTQNNSNVFDGNTFGTNASSTNTPNFAFNPPKQETPIAFGHGTTPIFGTPQTDPQTQAKSFPSNAPSSAGFNFGSTASAATSGFNFGGMPSSTPSGGFNFNPLTTSTPAVAFDPNSRPSFNFTKGSAPTSFNATPQSTGSQPQRKIKKAFRRCVR